MTLNINIFQAQSLVDTVEASFDKKKRRLKSTSFKIRK